MKKLLVIVAMITVAISSCTKDPVSAPVDFTGNWTLHQTYGNDYWGGPFYWKAGNPNTKIKFTTEGKYFRKDSTETEFTLIGSFLILPGSKIQITYANPPNPSYPTKTLDYYFEAGGFMTWEYLATEGIIKEKFKLNP